MLMFLTLNYLQSDTIPGVQTNVRVDNVARVDEGLDELGVGEDPFPGLEAGNEHEIVAENCMPP